MTDLTTEELAELERRATRDALMDWPKEMLALLAMARRSLTAPGWRGIESAPKDGTLLQLLVQLGPDDGQDGFDDSDITRTMGSNNFDNDGFDEWKFPGWSWTHDYITKQGGGTPIAWAMMLPLPAPPTTDAPASEE